MTPETIVLESSQDGVTMALTPGGAIRLAGTKDAVARWAPLVRDHKAELIQALKAANEPQRVDDVADMEPDPGALPDTAMERRRQEVLRMLRARPEITRAVLADGDADPVRVTLAVRNVGACELLIPCDRWDPLRFLELLRQHEGSA